MSLFAALLLNKPIPLPPQGKIHTHVFDPKSTEAPVSKKPHAYNASTKAAYEESLERLHRLVQGCPMSVADLADEIGVSESSIKKYIRALKEAKGGPRVESIKCGMGRSLLIKALRTS
jgi:biotin operon repressor